MLIDITERRRNEQVSRILAEVSATLAALDDPEGTLKGVARLALPFFADFCFIDLLEDDQTNPPCRRVSCRAPTGEGWQPDQVGRSRRPSILDLLIHRVLQSGRAEIVPEFSERSDLGARPGSPNTNSSIRELRPHSLICVPLAVRNRTFGAMTFILSESPRSYGPADLALAEDLAAGPPSPWRTLDSTRSSRTPTAARASSWRCSPMSFATRWSRSGTPCTC